MLHAKCPTRPNRDCRFGMVYSQLYRLRLVRDKHIFQVFVDTFGAFQPGVQSVHFPSVSWGAANVGSMFCFSASASLPRLRSMWAATASSSPTILSRVSSMCSLNCVSMNGMLSTTDCRALLRFESSAFCSVLLSDFSPGSEACSSCCTSWRSCPTVSLVVFFKSSLYFVSTFSGGGH